MCGPASSPHCPAGHALELMGAIMPEAQPNLNHRAELLLDCWFASANASERHRRQPVARSPVDRDIRATAARTAAIAAAAMQTRSLIWAVHRLRGVARAKRSRFITLVHAATKTFKNFSRES